LQLSWQAKRVRILIVMATIGLCAFFLAQGTTHLVALKLMPIRPMSVDTAGDKPTSPDHLPKGELPPDMHAILARNIFDPQTGSLWPPKPPEQAVGADGTKTEQEQQAMPLADGQMPPPCEGTVRLVASIFSPLREAWSFASLALAAGSPLLYRPGSTVEGKTVDSIYPEAVFLRNPSGVLCSLTMFKSPNQPPKAAPPVAAATEPVSSGEAELDQGIKQLSETKYNVRRNLVDKLLQNQAELMRSARVVPHEENGRVVGVKLYGIRKSSLLGKLGLQNGDMLRTINGFDMGSPDSALEAYAKLRSASNLSLAVVRRGNAVTMEYNIGQ
jgi:general secretion pathway protein C